MLGVLWGGNGDLKLGDMTGELVEIDFSGWPSPGDVGIHRGVGGPSFAWRCYLYGSYPSRGQSRCREVDIEDFCSRYKPILVIL